MWDSETERIGKQRCTRLGHALHAIADLIGFLALLLLICVAVYLGYRGVVATFHVGLLWLFCLPFGLAFIGTFLYRISWVIAFRRGFRYDSASREASWHEDGQKRTYKFDRSAEPSGAANRR